MSMKKRFLLPLLAIALCLTGCFDWGGGDDPDLFKESDLYGLWQEDGTEHYVRFLTSVEDGMDEEGYKFGKEWDEAERVYEDRLVYHGNGWFKWKLVQSDLTEIHLMDNGGAELPKVYVLTKLNSTTLVYQDSYKKSHSFSKVVEIE